MRRILVLTAFLLLFEVLVANGWYEQAKLPYKGYVSISADTVIVNDWSKTAAIYRRNGSTWSKEADLSLPGSVAIQGSHALVGREADGQGGEAAGAAHFYDRNGVSWNESTKVLASNNAPYNQFGSSTSMSGDYAVIGAERIPWAGTSPGSVHVFQMINNTWLETDLLSGTDTQVSDKFGHSVCVDGDRVVVGSMYNGLSGAAYIFEREGDSWRETKLVPSDPQVDQEFGRSVSISGDYAIVGSYRADNDAGAAYVFRWNGDNWSEMIKLSPADATGGDQFGISVDIDGNRLIVGSYGDDDPEIGVNTGSAYVFELDGNLWSETAKLTASDAGIRDGFGRWVSIDNDYAIVSASNEGAYIYVVPEPTTFGLLVIGSTGLLRRRKIIPRCC